MKRLRPRSLRTRHRTPCSGFTLVELSLVTTVLVILLAVLMPRFHDVTLRLRLEHSAFEIAHLLRYSHERAVAEQAEIAAQWDAQQRKVRIVSAAQEPGTLPEPSQRFLQSRPLPAGTDVKIETDGQAAACGCVRFFADGTSEPSVVTVSLSSKAYTISVNATTAQVSIQSGIPAR